MPFAGIVITLADAGGAVRISVISIDADAGDIADEKSENPKPHQAVRLMTLHPNSVEAPSSLPIPTSQSSSPHPSF